ncbi:MAG: DUF47 family protein [Bacteroidales bacterium]|jgi:hypothetical protein|nr:DUF47 family protein [Bacteroidales bacterium]MDD4214840.1 DUF47 family protein [Bacteroidales bacterium]
MGFSKIISYLTPKEKKFFPMFEEAAENLVKGATLLNKYFLISDKTEKEKIIYAIKEHENIGDNFTHKLYDELNKTFITPFDREDIYKLNGSLDDVMDMINSFGQKVRNHPPKTEPQCFLVMSELILQATREIKNAVVELKNLKNPKKIMDACIRLNEIENQADEVYHLALSDLFQHEKDAIELIKIKEMLNSLEKATDMAEDVSDVIKGIIVKAN